MVCTACHESPFYENAVQKRWLFIMIDFMYKFMVSMFQEQKKELFFILIGMVLCNCVILNFTDSVLGTDYTRDELSYYNNRITFTFSDTKQIEEIVDSIQKINGIEAVFLNSTDKISSRMLKVVFCTKIIPVKDDAMVTGHMPETLHKGEAVINLTTMFELGRTKNVLSVGETFKLGSQEFTCVAEANTGEFQVLLCKEDFFSMYEQYGEGSLALSYLYKDGFSVKQKEQIKAVVESIRKPDTIEVAEKRGAIGYSDFIESIQDLILGMVIAILNDMFLYAYVLNNRIPAYSILKLQGIPNTALRLLLFFELSIIYTISFIIAGSGYGIYTFATGNIFYNTAQIYLYTFISLFLMNIIIFTLFIQKLIRLQPFEIYRKRI